MYQSESPLCGRNVKFPILSAGNLFEDKISMTPWYLLPSVYFPFTMPAGLLRSVIIYTKEAKASLAVCVANQWRTKPPKQNL